MSGAKKTIIAEITLLVCLLVFLIVTRSMAADFQKGFEAAMEGDRVTAIKEWEPLAKQEGAVGLLVSGYMVAIGHGVPRDREQMLSLYTQSAEKGFAPAQFILGIIYNKSFGMEDDNEQSIYWLTKAAEQGFDRAQYELGKMYYDGLGVSQDYKRAFYWYAKAAEQGFGRAQYELGEMYYDGLGASQDYKQAFYCYTKAAEQGIATAQFKIGEMYDHGHGTPLDYKQAFSWHKKAAMQGVVRAQFRLGEMYDDGHGVPQNYINSYAWYTLAAASSDNSSKFISTIAGAIRDEFSTKKLSPEQIVYAQELAANIQYHIDHQDQSSGEQLPFLDTEPQIIGSGTGTVITTNGYILSCSHVIDGADTIKVKVAGKTYLAKIVRDDKYNDLALLKITGSFQALAFSSRRSAKIGQDMFTLGYPRPNVQGEGVKFTKGSISSLTGLMDDLRMYQISVPVQPGNSGGALLDMDGNITGVVVAMLDAETALNTSGSLPQNVNYAIKSIYAKTLIDTLPDVAKGLLSPSNMKSFEETVDMAQKSIVMILTYR